MVWSVCVFIYLWQYLSMVQVVNFIKDLWLTVLTSFFQGTLRKYALLSGTMYSNKALFPSKSRTCHFQVNHVPVNCQLSYPISPWRKAIYYSDTFRSSAKLTRAGLWGQQSWQYKIMVAGRKVSKQSCCCGLARAKNWSLCTGRQASWRVAVPQSMFCIAVVRSFKLLASPCLWWCLSRSTRLGIPCRIHSQRFRSLNVGCTFCKSWRSFPCS